MNEPHRGAAPQPHTGKQPTRREAARRRRRRQQRRACAVLLCVVVLAAAAGLIVVLPRLLGSTPAGAGSTAGARGFGRSPCEIAHAPPAAIRPRTPMVEATAMTAAPPAVRVAPSSS